MKSTRGIGVSLAVMAGLMAALASVAAKLAMAGETVQQLCANIYTRYTHGDDTAICNWVAYVLRIVCFAGIFVFNALMWTCYTKSLQYSSSTIESTITNTGSNFLCTAILSLLLFGERLSVLWWIGSCCILVGLILIHSGSQEMEKKEE